MNADPKSDLDVIAAQSSEDKLPSDESFQNYSTGLDFSTNLFDTDRIPNLDISGSSRSEDFNPYNVYGRDESVNDVEYNKFSSRLNESNSWTQGDKGKTTQQVN